MAANTAASTHHQFADSRLIQALANWSHTKLASMARTTRATPITAQRTHQYFRRGEDPCSSRAASAGASWDTQFRVTVQGVPDGFRRGMSGRAG